MAAPNASSSKLDDESKKAALVYTVVAKEQVALVEYSPFRGTFSGQQMLFEIFVLLFC